MTILASVAILCTLFAAHRSGPGRAVVASAGVVGLIYAPALVVLAGAAAGVRRLARTAAGRWTLARVSPGQAILTAGLVVLALVGAHGQGPDVTLISVHPQGQMAEAGR